MSAPAERVRIEIEKLIDQWEEDRRGMPTGFDWRADIADATVKLCIRELQNALDRAFDPVLREA